MKLLSILLFIVITSLISISHAKDKTVLPERVIWNDEAIPLHIQTGHERTVHFPDAIRYWLPDHLAHKLTALSANGVLYLQAHQSFSPTRIRIQSLSTQQIYLLDVQSSTTQGTTAKLIVLNPEQVVNDAKADSTERPLAQRDWYERLTRYAAQQLYAPERLLVGDQGIRRVAIDPMAVPQLFRDPRLTSHLIASWTGGGLFITAIRVHNTSDNPLELIFSEHPSGVLRREATLDIVNSLRGDWLAASVQHDQLHPASHHASMTTLYLLSNRPFFESWEVINGR